MWITQGEAVDMFARFLVARHGGAAIRVARKTANNLKINGDFEGQAVWNLVADAVESRTRNKTELESVMPVS